jgi:hypothetical protein
MVEKYEAEPLNNGLSAVHRRKMRVGVVLDGLSLAI